MKLTLIALALVTMSGSAMAKNLISVDKGTVKVRFNPNVSGHSIGYELPKECSKTKVQIKEVGNTVIIKHKGENCVDGATFTMILGDKYQGTPVEFTLNAGVLELPAAMKHYNKADVKVTAGMVDSRNLKGYCARKFPNPAGVKCSFKAADSKKERYDVTAKVKAGVLRM